MNAEKILEIIAKGFTLIEALRAATEAASPAIRAMFELIEKNQSGAEVTEEDLAKVEAELDSQLAAFNAPLPEDLDDGGSI